MFFRHALEFLKQSAGKWFGFFVNENATQSDFDSFEPFNNTVVVIDYVASREGDGDIIGSTKKNHDK